eukprot:TRINITY_DN57132_c0_g1_i1.p1 TRINITY_DN57132_c0_g1~~TRINITY_DN57132_c0_g1_i1.p1  ORF type:complete len:586 (+),score=99.53 TRINITY_DN57132_c0_g1_i1:204-1961(+)
MSINLAHMHPLHEAAVTWLLAPRKEPEITHGDTTVLVTDIGLATVALIIFGRVLYKRPKLVVGILIVITTWVICKLLAGQFDRSQLESNAEDTREASEQVVFSVGYFILAFAHLFVPLFVDLGHILEPVAIFVWFYIVLAWDAFTWKQRGMILLVIVGVVGTIYAALVTYRKIMAIRSRVSHEDVDRNSNQAEKSKVIAEKKKLMAERKKVMVSFLFSLSYVVVAPATCWGISQLVSDISSMIVIVFMSVWPTLRSMLILRSIDWERHRVVDEDEGVDDVPAKSHDSQHSHGDEDDNTQRPRTNSNAAGSQKRWWDVFDPSEKVLPLKLQARMQLWLAYWSCWPLFASMYYVVHTTTLVEDEDKAAGDGVIVALIFGAQIWEKALLAPYLCKGFMVCFGAVINKVSQWTAHLASMAMPCVAKAYVSASQQLNGFKGKFAKIGVIICVGLMVAVLAMKALALLGSIITLIVLLAAAADSARYVYRKDMDMIASRLAFWVVVMIWLWISSLPVFATLLGIWTPFVLVLALLVGEVTLNVLLKAINACLMCLFKNACPCFLQSKAATPSVQKPLLENDRVSLDSAQHN